MVADADFVTSATLVAVIVNDPGVDEENVAVVVETLLKLPPEAVQVTPKFPWSFTTAAENVMV
jgi:hypothetical protein